MATADIPRGGGGAAGSGAAARERDARAAPLLTVDDLAVARGGMPLLEGLRFTLSAGQALVLRGPNGIGKTTLLRTLAGLQPPLSGQIRWTEPESHAYAAHADGLKAPLTAAENLRFWARIHGREGTRAALEAFGLADLAARPAGRLSAGQKRRLGLARLMVAGRPVWLLDEPTVSLDVAAVADFTARLATHLAGGGAAVIATHVPLGLDAARLLDLEPFRARPRGPAGFDEAFA